MGTIHFFGGEKGGVGKSFICRTAIAYHQHKQLPFIVYDTDRTAPDVYRSHQDFCKLAVFSEAEEYENSTVELFDEAVDKTVLVNLAAQSFLPLQQWFKKNGAFKISKRIGIKYKIWFVSNGGVDSLKILEKSLTSFGGKVPHLFVPQLDFPRFVGNYDRNRIKKLSLSFLEAEKYPDFGIAARQRVMNFLEESFKMMDSSRAFR